MPTNDNDDDNDEMDVLNRGIRSEVSSIPIQRGYVLSDFKHEKTIENTSYTLLTLICKLVSGGKITKKSLTLAQCIQQHIDTGEKRNQTFWG